MRSALLLSTTFLLAAGPVLSDDVFRLSVDSPMLLSPSTEGPSDEEPPGAGTNSPQAFDIEGPHSLVARQGYFYSRQLSASGGTEPYTWQVLPNGAGASISGNVLVGTGNTGGSFPVDVVATDATGTPVTQTFQIEIGAPSVSVAASYELYEGGEGEVRPTYSGLLGTGTPFFLFYGNPGGLYADATGGFVGSPLNSGTFSGRIVVYDHDGTNAESDPFAVIVHPAHLISSTDETRIASVSTSGDLSNGAATALAATRTSNAAGTGPSVSLAVGESITIMFTEKVRAESLMIGYGSPDAGCWPNGSYGEVSFDVEITRDGSTWLPNSDFSASGFAGCQSGWSTAWFDHNRKAFEGVRVTLRSAKYYADGTDMPAINVFKLRAQQ